MQKINDFGQKIGGAKKDLWKKRNLVFEDTIEMTEAEKRKYIKRDNIWKKIDVEDYLEKGYSRLLVFWLKEVRACVYPDMKRTTCSVEEYIHAIEKMRDMILDVTSINDIDNVWKKILCEEGILFESSPHYYDYVTEYIGIVNGQKLLNLYSKGLRFLEKKMEKCGFGLSKQEFLSRKYHVVEYDKKNVRLEHSWYNGEKGDPYIVWEISGNKRFFYTADSIINLIKIHKGDYLLLSDDHHEILFFGSKSETIIAKCELINGLIAYKKERSKRKKKWIPKQLERLERKGKDYRHGYRIDGDDFLSAFKIRGGEFGNYTNDKDRQANLNMAYEAFCDLADALEISREDIGLRGLETGALAIAFGARGNGNALAHYEPEREVINLTKLRGAGSLAHEWGHALDDFIAKVSGLHTGEYASQSLRNVAIPETLKELIHRLIRNEDGTLTEFYSNSAKIDNEATKAKRGYWKSNVELFARAFACYVQDKLEESDKQNDYLCGHAEAAEYPTEKEIILAYPTGDERKSFFQLFDRLFVELKQLGYLHEPIDDYEIKKDSIFQDLASKNSINLDNAKQMTFADFGI